VSESESVQHDRVRVRLPKVRGNEKARGVVMGRRGADRHPDRRMLSLEVEIRDMVGGFAVRAAEEDISLTQT
jgi:hypothetical protein